jgi:hypothetical protein
LPDGSAAYAATLQAAAALATGGSVAAPVTIRLDAGLTIGSSSETITLTSGTHVRLVPDGADITISRAASGIGSLFTVSSGASLTLEGAGGHELVIDGGSENSITATDALITLSNGGKLTMNEGAVVQNNNNTNRNSSSAGDRGGVYVGSGATFTMTGGRIEGNKAIYGAGIYVSGTFIMNGGVIQGNTSEGTPPSGTGTDPMGGGIFVYLGTFNMNNGEIRNNTAVYNGGGVAIQSGTFTKTGGNVYGIDNSVYPNIAGSSGAALYKFGGTVTVSGVSKSTTNSSF